MGTIERCLTAGIFDSVDELQNNNDHHKTIPIHEDFYLNAPATGVLAERRAGVLLHPTSLPNGLLDQEAFRWLDFLADAGISVWQLLPLGVPQAGKSPYQCDSAFAMNPALIDENSILPVCSESEVFQNWIKEQSFWLHDYALFTTLKYHFDNEAWFDWPQAFRWRSESALSQFSKENEESILLIKWQQFKLYSLWQEIREYAHNKGIYLFGDMPIFVAHDSSDVWARPEYFLLDENGQATVVAGVPPDYFSETGQRWGNPHYNWEKLRERDFDWWMDRLHAHFEWFDIVRIDHFRGLQAVWTIERDCPTAVEGFWQTVPGDELLALLSAEKGQLQLVAEDLGIITPEVTALRDKYNLPGMSVLQFSFDAFDDNPHKPKNIKSNTVVYTGTHDNDTTKGWFDALPEHVQHHVLNQIGATNHQNVTETMIDRCLHTQANLAVIPLQDFLSLGSEARMNTPGTVENNWSWNYRPDQISPELAQHIHRKIQASGRLR